MLSSLWRRLPWGREEPYRHAAEKVRRLNAETARHFGGALPEWHEITEQEMRACAADITFKERFYGVPVSRAYARVFMGLPRPSLPSRLRSWWRMRAGSL